MFAKFFPTAPSVLQQKKSRSNVTPEKKQSTSSTVAETPGAAPGLETGGVPATRDAAAGQEYFAAIIDGDSSNIQEENENAQGDLLNGVGSASSTSTVSSVFSATNQPQPMTTYGVSQSFLTPLTTSDSSPSGKTSSPPPISLARERSSPGAMSRLSETAVERILPSPVATAAAESLTPPSLTARLSGRVVKGNKVVYDPELDRKLTSKERRARKVQYSDFGEEVSSSCLSHH